MAPWGCILTSVACCRPTATWAQERSPRQVVRCSRSWTRCSPPPQRRTAGACTPPLGGPWPR
eukprot:5356900-Pyramimonas_sp.AAC.1